MPATNHTSPTSLPWSIASVLTRILQLVYNSQACNQFTYAFVLRCPVADNVRAGQSDPNTLIETIDTLAIAMADVSKKLGIDCFLSAAETVENSRAALFSI